MKLSTKSRYAISAMMDLALNDNEGPVALSSIFNKQEISLSYLEQLFAQLRQSGLVQGVRGPGGGYQLSKLLSHIGVADIIMAVDDTFDGSMSHHNMDTKESELSTAHHLWNDLSQQLFDFLHAIHLSQFIKEPEVKKNSKRLGGTAHHISTVLPVSEKLSA